MTKKVKKYWQYLGLGLIIGTLVVITILVITGRISFYFETLVIPLFLVLIKKVFRKFYKGNR